MLQIGLVDTPPSKVLRDYQCTALDRIADELAAGGRATAVLACGTGKSILGVHVAETLCSQGDFVAVFAPSLALLEQLHRTYSHNMQRTHRTMVVCSQDDLLGSSSTEDVAAPPITTSDNDIAKYLSAPTDADLTVIFSTYHSAPRLADAAHQTGTTFSLLIADEAHRTAGKKDATFTTVLSQAKFTAKRRLFLTATRRIHTGADDTLSMDDTALYGKTVYTYPFGQAIADGWLSDYRVAIAIVTDADIHRAILNDSSIAVGGDHFNARRAAAVLALQDACKRHDLRRVLAFHNTVSASRQFASNLQQFNRLSAEIPMDVYHLDSLASPAARRGALNHLKNPQPGYRTVVNNVRVLAEGVDIPALDAVMFAEPKRSQIDVVQAVGRAIRRNPERSDPAIILLPVYVAPGESPAAVLSGSEYRHIWQVIQALRDHDDTLDAQIRHIRRNDYDPDRSTYEPNALPEKILVYGTSVDATEFTAAVETMILDTTTTTWAEGLDHYRAYVETTGSHDVPSRHITNTAFPLGQWQSNQRQAYRWNRLSPAQINELENAGFNWGERSRQWRNNIERLSQYDTALNYHLDVGLLADIDPPALAWIMSIQERARRGLLSPNEQEELRRARIPSKDLTWETIGVSDESAAILGRPLTLFLKNVRRFGHEKAETMTVAIRTKSPQSKNRESTITRYPGTVIASRIRHFATHGVLDTALLEQIKKAGMPLPEVKSPLLDVANDPEWQDKLLIAMADITAGRTPTCGSEHPPTQSPIAADTDPNPMSLTGLGALNTDDITEHITGPTIADVKISLNQIPEAHGNFGPIDLYATEMTQDIDGLSGYVVGLDHTVYRPNGNGWTTAGKLHQRIDGIALIFTPLNEHPDGGRLMEHNGTLHVRDCGIPNHLKEALGSALTGHVMSTIPDFARRIVRSTFGIRDVRIFSSATELDRYLKQASRRNRTIAQPGPEFCNAFNHTLIHAVHIAQNASYEQTVNKLRIALGDVTMGRGHPSVQ